MMPLTSYQKGPAFEYRVKRWLEARGWDVVRSPQSKGPPDLWAMQGPLYRDPRINAGRYTFVWLIECKVNKRDFSKKERGKLCVKASCLGAMASLAHRGPAPKYEILWEEVT